MDDRMNAAIRAGQIHPAPQQFTADQIATDPILHFFHYAHLPAALQSSSAPFCALASLIVDTLPRNAERTVALRKLLEAKDAAVRANVGAVASGGGGSFIDRLKTERDELDGRLRKLAAFLNSDGTAEAGEIQTELLREQRRSMAEYLAILNARIENIEHAARLDEGAREVGDHDAVRDPPRFMD